MVIQYSGLRSRSEPALLLLASKKMMMMMMRMMMIILVGMSTKMMMMIKMMDTLERTLILRIALTGQLTAVVSLGGMYANIYDTFTMDTVCDRLLVQCK